MNPSAKPAMRPEETDFFRILNEHYPHHGNAILVTWGSRECRAYMQKLTLDTRDGHRAGFAPEIATALFQLLNLHDSQWPQLVDDENVWESGLKF